MFVFLGAIIVLTVVGWVNLMMRPSESIQEELKSTSTVMLVCAMAIVVALMEVTAELK